jgi:hypothetical protein
LRFVVLVEESMNRDVVTPLYWRIDALERETEELRGRLARVSASAEGKAAG